MNPKTPQTPEKQSIYTYMQMAVDIVNTSPHPTSKIAATLVGQNEDGTNYTICKTNHWPPIIAERIGTDTKIGNSSGTIHAETACLLSASQQFLPTNKAKIFITDPPCPNCVKNMAEAGITALYIDHKGLDKDWMARRKESFSEVSMRIAAKAGIDVYILYRKEHRFEVISQHSPGYKPREENPAIITPCNDWKNALKQTQAQEHHSDESFAFALATNENNQTFSILTKCHPTIGYTHETLDKKTTKYSFILQPLNRLMMVAAKNGLRLDHKHIYSSRVPTSRELVNFVENYTLGNQVQTLYIGKESDSRDPNGLTALKTLKDLSIISVITNT